MPSTRSLLLALAVAGLSASPASAATLTLDHECYVNAGSAVQPIVATAGGLTPGQTYNVGFTAKGGSGETGYAFGDADPAGALGLTLNSWYGGSPYEPKVYDATVVLRDNSQNVLASVDTKTTSATIDVKGTGAKRSWKVTGLAAITGGDTYYAHYFSGTKYRGRLKIGKASGPCGYFAGKRPLTPFSRLGRFDVKVTTTRSWAAGDPFIPGRIVVTKRYR